jgi:DNA polymerase-3 subunit epsilon
MEKIFYFDVETTSLDPKSGGIHQIGIIIEIDGKTKERLVFNLAPFQGDIVTDEALEVAGVTRLQIMAYKNPLDIYEEIVSLLNKYVNKFDKQDKMFLCGFNNQKFDNEFLRNFFKKCGDNYFGSYFWANSLDILVLATLSLMKVRKRMDDFKLKTVCKQLGIEVDEEKLHDALYDIDLTRACLYKIRGI